MTSVLVIEDDLTFSKILGGFLTKKDFAVSIYNKGNDGLKAFHEKEFDIVLLDYRLPDTDGLELLQKMKQKNPAVSAIIMTSFNDVPTAVKAIQLGATNYILKPLNPDELLMVLNNIVKSKEKGTDKKKKDKELKAPSYYMEGDTPISRELYKNVSIVAPTDLSVIIKGESGTGKEYIARSIHRLSPRAEGAFVAVDCGAISKELAASELFGHVKGSFTGAIADYTGTFEMANGGTLFLDEVGNLSMEVQIKLLRAIQERKIQPLGSNKTISVDVRIITATNEDLGQMVRNGEFREDLFHRLNEFDIMVPPLRERGSDLTKFASLFRQQANEELSKNTNDFDEDVIAVFQQYHWPGNLRELRNVVKRAVLFTAGDSVEIGSLPSEMAESILQRKADVMLQRNEGHDEFDLRQQERELIIKTLLHAGNNKSKAARMLHIDRKTLYMKMKKYDIE